MGTNPDAYDNVALRTAMMRGKRLMWFIGVAPALYHAEYPVWLAGEEEDRQQFVVALDDTMQRGWEPRLSERSPFNPARRYAEAIVRVRLHQRPFRDRVLLAYGSQCALCRLRHPPLLDAAHIKKDSDGGEPIVPNGMAMCAIHHRAFDSQGARGAARLRGGDTRRRPSRARWPNAPACPPGSAPRANPSPSPARGTAEQAAPRGALRAVQGRWITLFSP